MTKEEVKWEEIWKKPVIRIGMVTLLVTAAMTFLPIIYISMKYGIFPPVPVLLRAWGMIAVLFGAFYIIEPISYYPVLGLSGTYMSFLAGNISNLRMPCSAMAQEVTEVKPASHEADIISTLGIAGSVITSLCFVSVGAFAGFVLVQKFPPAINYAFKNYAVPAIFGAILGQFALRHPKIGIIALSIALITLGIFRAPSWLAIIISVFGTIGISRLLYNKGKV